MVFWKWGWTRKEKDPETGKRVEVRHDAPLLRYYSVFNVAQCAGVEAPTIVQPEREHSPIQTAETIVSRMQKRPTIEHDSRQACYVPPTDTVRMPRPEVFESATAYYATLFHELTHSTGHSNRLNRKIDTELATVARVVVGVCGAVDGVH